RYGTVDVFYFDFYSIALSKIHRGNTRDINDVKLLLQEKVITLQGLDDAYNEILPQVGKVPYKKLDPKQFAASYTAVRKLLQGLSSCSRGCTVSCFSKKKHNPSR